MFEHYDEILTVSELADYLKIGLSTAYSIVSTGEIESFKVKGSYRIEKRAIREYIINKNCANK